MVDLSVTKSSTQAVMRGSGGGTYRVSAMVVQVVRADISRRVRVAGSTVQVVHSGTGGARMRNTTTSVQVVWTTGAADGTRQRAWTFDLDGHTFYVLDMGGTGALVYDLVTQQWSKFVTEGFDGGWNFKNGFHWRDGDKVVGGYDGEGKLLYLTPDTFLDEGWRPVIYEVRGVLQHSGLTRLRQYSLRMVGSSGVTADSISPVLNMRFSDDRGETWSDEYSITLTTNTQQRIEFRSLGAFAAPGRIFRIYDEGGIKFLGYVEAEIGGMDGGPPA